MQPQESITIQDLLLSQPTILLVEKLGLLPALYHVRAIGGRQEQRQRVRGLGMKQRETATFVEVEVEARTGPKVQALLLVEEEWDLLIKTHGKDEMTAGSFDGRFALAEIEARLRQDPKLAGADPGHGYAAIAAANGAAGQHPTHQPTTSPAGPKAELPVAMTTKGTEGGSSRPPEPPNGNRIESHAVASRPPERVEGAIPASIVPASNGDEEPTPEQMEADGVPRELFKERPSGGDQDG